MLEVASLLEDRSTSRTGIFAPEFSTTVRSDVTTVSFYFLDTLAASPSARTITFSGRYDDTGIDLEDPTGANPDLDGSHDFSRFNPAIGATFKLTPAMTLYASYGESARAPTPVELECASEEAPCSLPNAFLADPPLDQVVARSFEAGLRGQVDNGIRWHAGAFSTTNNDDILFQTTGGASANVGFFDNVGDTRRSGIELNLVQERGPLAWSVEYSYLDASFEDAFVVSSPNHPGADDDGEAGRCGGGSAQIPGIPEHEANIGLDYAFTDRLQPRRGPDVAFRRLPARRRGQPARAAPTRTRC